MEAPVAPEGGIQLLPQTRKKIDIVIPGQTRNLVLSMLALLVIAGGYFALLNYRNNLFARVADINTKLKQIDDSRDLIKEKELLMVGKQLVSVNSIIQAHITWSQAFEKLHKLIIPQVKLKSISVSVDRKKFSFGGSADNYTSVARQVSAFYTDSAIIDIEVGQVSVQTNGRVDFSMDVAFQTDQYLHKPVTPASTASQPSPTAQPAVVTQ